MEPIDLVLVGCGKMGGAMLRGWLDQKIVGRAFVIEPSGVPDDFAAYVPNPVTFYDSAADLNKDLNERESRPSIFVIAVKPQIMETVCRDVKPLLTEHSLILSIAAGQRLKGFAKYFGDKQPAIRVMPNTPSSIGQGISVCVANQNTNEEQRTICTSMMNAVGKTEWINDETLMNAVTALSGSGPAYIFLLIETLARSGEKCGLAPDLAMRLARQTVIGSAALADQDNEISASILRENVTSPGGTTEAALKALMDDGELQSLFDKALLAAKKRGEELG